MRKNNPSSSAVESAGDVAEGDTITIPLGRATFCKIAPVTPEQSAPMIASTLSDVIKRSAAAVAAAASMQVESPRTGVTVAPSSNLPDAVTSFIASSAPKPIEGVIVSSGPVKPKITPILISSLWLPAIAVPAVKAAAAVAIKNFLILLLPCKDDKSRPNFMTLCRKRKVGMLKLSA